jgi:hypothetical protein
MRLWIPVLSLLFALSVESPMRADGDPNFDEAAAKAAYRKWYNALRPVAVYGRVIDLESNAVEGVTVQLGWDDSFNQWGGGRKSFVTSDKNGFWEFHAKKAHYVVLNNNKINRGFEYLHGKKDYGNLLNLQTTKTNPVIVWMRKRVNMTYLYKKDNNKQLRATSAASDENKFCMIARPESNAVLPDSYTDLVISAWFVPGTNMWAIRYSATNGSDGLVLGSNILYQAPNEGYEKEIVLQGPPWPKYLYLRSRSPAIYSRVEFSYYLMSMNDASLGFSLYLDSETNPYGDRSLEYDPGCEAVQVELKNEVERAFALNQRPVKPDISALLKKRRLK